MTASFMLALENVGKDYDLRPVLDDVTVSLESGQRYVLTAPNGSGKTTLLRVMAGLSKPNRGTVLWDGEPFDSLCRRHIGVALQEPFLYGDLSGVENLSFFAALYSCRRPRQLATEWIERIGLEEAGDRKVREYSKGMKQRLSLARAMIHAPQVLLLDEPFDGLDDRSRAQMEGWFQDAQQSGTAIFLVTHETLTSSAAIRRFTLRYGRLEAVT